MMCVVKVQVSGPVGAGTGGSVETMTIVEGATVGEYVVVSKDSINGTRKNAGETVSYPSVGEVIGILCPITGESVKTPDVVADVGIPFDDTANSPLGRILGPKVILLVIWRIRDDQTSSLASIRWTVTCSWLDLV
jgi:hypothetical protein